MAWLKAEVDDETKKRVKRMRDARGYNNLHETAAMLIKSGLEVEEP